MASQRLLLIEDDISLGELLMLVFDRTGHKAAWYVRARLRAAELVLMDADGVESILKPERFELALVDYRLKGSPIDGPDVTAHLVTAGLPVVAVSGLQSLNQVMIERGARGGIAKDQLVSLLLSRTLVIDGDFAGWK